MPIYTPFTTSTGKVQVRMHEREKSHQVKEVANHTSDYLQLNRQLSQLMRALEDNDRDGAEQYLVARSASLPGLMHVASQNKLLGYLHCLLEDNGLSVLVSPKTRADLEAGYADQKARSEKNMSLIRLLVERLEGAGLEFLTIKGLYISQRFLGESTVVLPGTWISLSDHPA